MARHDIAYRPDIDGLRAIAVLAVIGFHLFPENIVAGFVGVDIFFVISGFLITHIIQRELTEGTFSFRKFYSRRIRRIFPALLIILFSCLVAGWILLFPVEYAYLGKHLLASSAFFSNFLLRAEGGYFDVSNDTKPLLHLWSLAIEEQFYILWPLVLWAIGSRSRLLLRVVVILLLFSSFYSCLMTMEHSSAAGFFMPYTRFWELGLGAILALSTHMPTSNTAKQICSSLGFLLILYSIFTVPGGPFPGQWALPPTLGAMLLIASGAQGWVNRFVLSHRPLVFLGLISYPLYLWHWVLISFIRTSLPAVPLSASAGYIFMGSLALAWSTYKWVEKPIRYSSSPTTPVMLVVVMVIVGISGYCVYASHGFAGLRDSTRTQNDFLSYFDNRPPMLSYSSRLDLAEKYGFECDFYDTQKWKDGLSTKLPRASIASHCYERNSTSSHAVFIWGDSHAQHLRHGLITSLPDSWQLLQIASSGCNPKMVEDNAVQPADFCSVSNASAFKTIREAKPDVVVIAQNSGHEVTSMALLKQVLERVGVKKIIFVGPTPHWMAGFPSIAVRHLWPNISKRTMRGIDAETIVQNSKLQSFADAHGLIYANVIDDFCDAEGCLTHLGNDVKQTLTFIDYGHFSPAASEYFARHTLTALITDEVLK